MALKMALEGRDDAIILANRQIKGPGRWGRKWETGKGNIALSVLKKYL
jgi:biotin-(acetyl-CoA carboxylase) ligase